MSRPVASLLWFRRYFIVWVTHLKKYAFSFVAFYRNDVRTVMLLCLNGPLSSLRLVNALTLRLYQILHPNPFVGFFSVLIPISTNPAGACIFGVPYITFMFKDLRNSLNFFQ